MIRASTREATWARKGSEIGARCYTWKGVPEGEGWSKRGKAGVSKAGVVFKYSLIN